MQTHQSSDILDNYMKWWQAHTHQVGQIHGQFLELRQAGLQQAANSMEVTAKSENSLNKFLDIFSSENNLE